MTQTMTLHRVLSELKTLDNRIYDSINRLELAGLKKGDKFLLPVSEDEFTTKAKASLDSVEALIERRHTLKRALIMANATNTVEVNGKTLTIAEAIDYKSVIVYKKAEYQKLSKLYADVKKKYDDAVMENERKLETFILNMTGKESAKLSSTELEQLTATFNKTNKVEIVDPVGLKEKVDTLKDEIDTFTCDIDAILSEANAVVTVEV